MADGKHTPGPWQVRQTLTPRSDLRYVVQRMLANGQPETRCSASGKRSLFKTSSAANRCARRLNDEARVESELRTKYADQSSLRSVGTMLARATGAQS